MKRNSTFVGKAALIVLIFSLNFFIANSQCVAPAMVYQNAVLLSGTAGTIGATYKFPSVTPGVDAHFTITDIVGGASLTSIDDLTYGYNAAWQPVVKTPMLQGASESYISFLIEFIDSANGDKHKYDCAQLSFIDVDGDGQHVKEFVAARGYDSYTVANVTVLTLHETTQGSSTMLQATGTYGNFAGLDTSSYVTNINFKYKNIKKIDEVRVGCITDVNFTVQDRYSCGYFKEISMPAIFIILPVKYINFDATVSDKSVLLNWVTTLEINNDHFEVQRSFDANNFKTIGLVMDPLEVAGDKRTYKFKDNSSELKGQQFAYYRLKQIDRDGKFSYSTVLAVRFLSLQTENVKMTVSPNPFAEKLTVRFDAAASGIAEMRIMNLAGQSVMTKQTTMLKGYNNLLVENLSKLAPGVYIVQLLMNGTIIENQKIVKN